jgi:hypothetical protein
LGYQKGYQEIGAVSPSKSMPFFAKFLNHKGTPILLANSNQWYFNKLVKISCHKTPYRCPHRLNLSSQSSRSYAGPNTKVLKDKDLEFANSIGTPI